MSTVITPERTTVTVVIEPTQLERDLNTMIHEVKQGRWCRNTVFDGTRRCALGMLIHVTK